MKKLFAAVAVLAIAVAPASANLLTNGDFETGDTTGWTVATFWSPSWGSAAPVLDAKTGIGTFGGLGIPYQGQYSLATDVAGHGNYHVGAYQTFDTVVGEEYVVDGWFAGGCEAANDTAWWEVKVSPGATSDPDAAGSVMAKNDRPAGAGHIEFQETFNNTFVASDTQTTLFLKWGRAESADWKVSAAGFDALSVALVPEPASLLLLLAGLPLLRRRRH